MSDFDRIEEQRELATGLEYEASLGRSEQGLTLEQVVEAVDGYRVIRHRGDIFVQPRTRAEIERLRGEGATIKETLIYGELVCEAHVHTMLELEPEYDELGMLIDNRREILLSFFRERDGDARPGLEPAWCRL